MMGNLAPLGIGPLCAPARFVGKADEPLIKLQKASQDGEEVGVAKSRTKKEQVSVLGTGSLLRDATLGDLVFKLPNTVRKAIGSSL
jgi:hypothetical protein